MSTKYNTPKEAIRGSQNNPLYTAATWLAHKSFSRKSEQKTQDLVGVLLSHGARAWRMSQPRSVIRVKTRNPSGFTSLRIKV